MTLNDLNKKNDQRNKREVQLPGGPPGRGVPGASPEDRPPEPLLPPRARAATGVQLGTPAGDRGSEPGETVTAGRSPPSASSASATPPAGAGGWS